MDSNERFGIAMSQARRREAVRNFLAGSLVLVPIAAFIAYQAETRIRRGPITDGRQIQGAVTGLHSPDSEGLPELFLIVTLADGSQVQVRSSPGVMSAVGQTIMLRELVDSSGAVVEYRIERAPAYPNDIPNSD